MNETNKEDLLAQLQKLVDSGPQAIKALHAAWEAKRTELVRELKAWESIKGSYAIPENIRKMNDAGITASTDLSYEGICDRSSNGQAESINLNRSEITSFKKGFLTSPRKIMAIVDSFGEIAPAQIFILAATKEQLKCFSEEVIADIHDGPATFLVSSHDSVFSIGPIVVIRRFSEDSGAGGGKEGFRPSQIQLSSADTQFEGFDKSIIDLDARSALEEKIRAGKEKNTKKYCLVDVDPRHHITDQPPKVTLRLVESDYLTIKSVLPTITNKEDDYGRLLEDRSGIRAHHANVDPRRNRVPNSLCLHYIVESLDGKFLAVRRSDSVAYDKNRISVSGEEQLDANDFRPDVDDEMDHWIKRSLLEEVFARSGSPVESVAGRKALEMLGGVKLFSLIHEERFANFALVAKFQLNCSLDEYEDVFRKNLVDGGKHSVEGRRYYFKMGDLEEFYYTGRLRLAPVAPGAKEAFAVTERRLRERGDGEFGLHSSSLYRLYLIRPSSIFL